MLSAKDLGPLMIMMPSFGTDNAGDILATDTIDVDRLHHGVNRMIEDGGDVFATTGSFGECHTLLPEEFRVLVRETVAAVKKRVPLFLGVTSLNTREAIEKMRIVEASGADGVLIGAPYYFPSSVRNAVRFFTDIAAMFPKINLMIYHNPPLHHVRLPIEVFTELVNYPNIIALKDTHRDPVEFLRLQKIIAGKIHVFVHQGQFFQFYDVGAPGFWSFEAWMGPGPIIALRDAVKRGDRELAKTLTEEIMPNPPITDLGWRETAAKVAIRQAGYVDPGPMRPPFLEIPPEVQTRINKRVEDWKKLSARYPARSADLTPA